MHRKRLRSSEYEEALAPGHPKQLMASWRTLFYRWLIKHFSFVASSERLRRQSAFLLTFRILCRHSVYTFLVQHLSHNQHFFSNRLIFIFCPDHIGRWIFPRWLSPHESLALLSLQIVDENHLKMKNGKIVHSHSFLAWPCPPLVCFVPSWSSTLL